MTVDYFQTTIGDQVTLQRGFDITKKQQVPGTIPVVSSGGVSSYHNIAKVSGPGVVLGRKGSLGTVFYLKDDYWPHDTSLWVRDFKGNNPSFVYYFFKSIDKKLKGMDVGAANPSLNRNHVHLIDVNWPSRKIQDFIANLLSVLDDKIALHFQINQTLEDMVQAIFKSWFVDFDPVKAKMRSESSKDGVETDATTLAAEILALFPSKLVDSELGMIPEGWKVSTIGEEVTVVGGGTPSKKNTEFWDDGMINWTSPKDLSGVQDKVLLRTASKITELGLNKISSGLLPVDTVLLSSRAPVGYLALAKIPLAINQGYIAMKCEQELTPEYTIQWCVHNMDEIKQRATGSTFAEISKKNFKPIAVVVPSENVLAAYQKQVQNIYDQISCNCKQNSALVALRDTLLPKLLSGEIDLSKAEEMTK